MGLGKTPSFIAAFGKARPGLCPSPRGVAKTAGRQPGYNKRLIYNPFFATIGVKHGD